MNVLSLPWREIQRKNFTSLAELTSFLELSSEQSQRLLARPSFPLNLPRRLAEKIEKQRLDDPILRQFVPTQQELEQHPEFSSDPVADQLASIEKKCVKKYAGRVLLLTTGACAMHCRYCFRQNYPYTPHQAGLTKELSVIRSDPSVKEVILSGGDPLSLSNRHLATILTELDSIEHVKRIRFHTRFPIGIPERIEPEFLQLLASIQTQIWFVVHSNHPKELDPDVLTAFKQIQKLGIPVLNQWVLLRGVNDDLDTLKELCEKLSDHGIFPYYLHQLDRVEGGAHFEVSEEKGRYLIQELTKQLSGYSVPKYVREIPGEPSKTPL